MNPPLDHQEQAALLARWLEEHPGFPAPEGLDPEVLETVYALRPDLAPAPSFSIDDILAGVTNGPFAAAPAEEPPIEEIGTDEVSAEAPGEPAGGESPAGPPALAPVVELAPARPQQRAWLWPAAGALAAAAMALIVVTPFLDHGVPRLDSPEPTMTAAPSLDGDLIAEAAAPRAEPVALKSAHREVSEAEESLPPNDLPVAPAEPKAGADAGGFLLDDSPTRTGNGGRSATVVSSTEQAPRVLEAQRTVAPAGGEARDAASLGSATAPKPASTLDLAEPLGGWAEDNTARTQSATPSASPPEEAQPATVDASSGFAPTPTASYDLADDDFRYEQGEKDVFGFEEDELAMGEASVFEGASARSSREDRKRAEEDLDEPSAEPEEYDREKSGAILAAERRRAERAPKASARPRVRRASELSRPPSSPEPDAPAPVVAEVAEDGVDALRSQASPLDYRADWYLRDPSLDAATRATVAATFAKSQSAIVAGDVSAAMAALTPLLSSPHPAVAQDAAFRLATLQLQGGEIDQASAIVRRGLNASGSPTVFRSRLLALQGAIQEEAGRPAEAVESYREAAEDNDARH